MSCRILIIKVTLKLNVSTHISITLAKQISTILYLFLFFIMNIQY